MLMLSIYIAGLVAQIVSITRFKLCVAVGVLLCAVGLDAAPSEYGLLERVPLVIIGIATLFYTRNLFTRLAVLMPIMLMMIMSVLLNYESIDADNYRSALSIILILFITIVTIKPSDAEFIARFVMLSPLSIVLVGLVLQIFGQHALFKTDYLGNLRLQGATIAAYLGAAALPAFYLSVREFVTSRQIKWAALGAINLAVLFLTGARMPLALAIICTVGAYCHTLFRRGAFGKLALGATVATAVLIVVGTFAASGFGRFSEFAGGADYTSGRIYLWSLLTADGVLEHPFGHGIGEATKYLRSQNLKIGTIAPHNEYIRFYFDIGILGAIVFFVSLLYVLTNRSLMGRNIQSSEDSYIWVGWYILALFLFSLTDNVLTMTPSIILLMAVPILFSIGGVAVGARKFDNDASTRRFRRFSS